jgi:hypothetical protein
VAAVHGNVDYAAVRTLLRNGREHRRTARRSVREIGERGIIRPAGAAR